MREYIERSSQSAGDALKSYFIGPYEKYYLRSLGDDARKDVADFSQQFPQVSPYFLQRWYSVTSLALFKVVVAVIANL